jgi:hypothetical protein
VKLEAFAVILYNVVSEQLGTRIQGQPCSLATGLHNTAHEFILIYTAFKTWKAQQCRQLSAPVPRFKSVTVEINRGLTHASFVL